MTARLWVALPAFLAAVWLGWALCRAAAINNPPPTVADGHLGDPVDRHAAQAMRAAGWQPLSAAEAADSRHLLEHAWTPEARELAAQLDERAGWPR